MNATTEQMLAGIARYFTESTTAKPIYVALRDDGGAILTWSTGKGAVKRSIGNQWEPHTWRIMRLSEVPNV